MSIDDDKYFVEVFFAEILIKDLIRDHITCKVLKAIEMLLYT